MREKVYAAILGLLLSGCSTISEYNQGCRDGITVFVEEGLHAHIESKVVENGCDVLDDARFHKKEARDQK